MALPARFVVPGYSAVMAVNRDVVIRQPNSPTRYIPRRELILSCNQAPSGLYIRPAVVSHRAERRSGMWPVSPRFVYRITA
jgi:hypothetical protein